MTKVEIQRAGEEKMFALHSPGRVYILKTMNGSESEFNFWDAGLKAWIEFLSGKEKAPPRSSTIEPTVALGRASTAITEDKQKRQPLKGHLQKKGDKGPTFVQAWKKRWFEIMKLLLFCTP